MALPRHAATTTSTTITQGDLQFGPTTALNSLVLQGNFAGGLTINPLASVRTDYAGHYAHTSLRPVRTYVDRPVLCHQIREQLNRASNDHLGDGTRVLAVWGLGGAGKTQLVLDYLCRYRNDYKATFWIDAGRKESIERDFVYIYHLLLGLQMTPGQNMIKADEAVLGVKSWLSSRSNDRWLLVFDGADAIDNEKDDGYIDLNHYVPESRLLDVIMTTRSRTAKDMTALDGIEVGEMEEDQAVNLFYSLSTLKDRSHHTKDEIKLIVKELGLFALAVTLAGTYVAQTPRLLADIKQYLPEYHDRRRELLGQKPTKLIHQYGESVLTTWEASFTAVLRQCAEACELLTLMAFLNFDDIFLGLFHTEPSEQYSSKGTWRLLISPDALVDKYKIEKCFKALQMYSLVQWKEDQGSYSMHKLVHAWGYERLEVDQKYLYSAFGLQLLREAILKCKEEPQAKLRLVLHIMANFSMVARQVWSGDFVETILSELGVSAGFIYELGRFNEAYVVREYVYREWSRILGDEHPNTISAISDLAITLKDQGQLEQAAVILKEVVAKRKRMLGDEHYDTLSAMNSLAIVLGNQGQLEQAAAIQKEVLEKFRRTIGDKHHSTITVMGNLAYTLTGLGQREQAAVIREKVVEERKRAFGDDHLDTISAMYSLASTLNDQGQLEQAVAIQKEVAEKMRRILGDEHPDTISAMNNLATTLLDQGQLEQAAAILGEVLEKRKRILGDEHPETLSAMHNLASTLVKQGQLEQAATIRKEVVEKRKRILGDEHPDTISAMNNLASTLRHQGQLEQVVVIQKDVVQKRKRILGDEHPDTISAMSNLAIVLGDQGQLEQAAVIQKEVVEKGKRILGDEHPDTLTAMNNLASTLRHQGQLEQAVVIQKDVVEKRKRILGDEHPDTISAVGNLAVMLWDQGQLEQATAIQKEVVEKMRRTLGDEHPLTKKTVENLEITTRPRQALPDIYASPKRGWRERFKFRIRRLHR